MTIKKRNRPNINRYTDAHIRTRKREKKIKRNMDVPVYKRKLTEKTWVKGFLIFNF